MTGQVRQLTQNPPNSRNLSEIIRSSAANFPAKPALIDGSLTLSYAALDAVVDAAAALVADQMPGQGERIGVLLPNSLEFAVAFFAVLRAGHVVLPLSTAYTANELGHQLGDCSARLVLTDAAHAAVARDAAGEATVWVIGEDLDLGLSGRSESSVNSSDPREQLRGGEDLAVVLYTSGTSGRPKGAMLSHRALLANHDQLSAIDPPIVTSDDVSLLVLPLFHVYGLNAGLCLALHKGATAVLAREFDPVATLRAVKEHHVTTLIGAPPMYVAWSMLPDLRDSLGSLRLAVSGAAPLPPTVQADVLAASGVRVYEGYGLTETSPVVTTALCSPVDKPGSIGRPIPGVDLRLLDDDGDEVDEDDPGEIAVRGDNLFSGYWPDGADGPDADGWWRTGDIAYADDDGDLFLIDRARELILVSGFNVYPREVEDVISSYPGVAEVAVIGVPHPYTGETVKALVVPARKSTITAPEIIDHAAKQLARFKCPTTIEFVSDLPHSLTGKVAKGRLRAARRE